MLVLPHLGGFGGASGPVSLDPGGPLDPKNGDRGSVSRHCGATRVICVIRYTSAVVSHLCLRGPPAERVPRNPHECTSFLTGGAGGAP